MPVCLGLVAKGSSCFTFSRRVCVGLTAAECDVTVNYFNTLFTRFICLIGIIFQFRNMVHIELPSHGCLILDVLIYK